MYAYIFNIQQFSIHDGPGIRTTVFFQGCPLQCAWCHNPEGIPQLLASTDGNINHSNIRMYSLDDLMEEILKDKVFFDESGGGVTFSGGEPLMQTAFLIEILTKLRALNIHTAIDTSGYVPFDIFTEVVKLTDLVLFDLKIIDHKKHRLYTGSGNNLIHKNLKQLINGEVPFRVRIPLINEITTNETNLEGISDLLEGKGIIEIDLLSYHDLGQGKQEIPEQKKIMHNFSAPDDKNIALIRKKFESKGFKVNIGG